MRTKTKGFFRRLSFQSLEDRRVLVTFSVSTLADENDGNFSVGDLSLREAIEQAKRCNLFVVSCSTL